MIRHPTSSTHTNLLCHRATLCHSDLRDDDAMPDEELLLTAEHVHGAGLALGIAALPARQLRHHTARIHSAGEHVAVVAISGDHRILGLGNGLHAHHDSLLADVEVTEAADQAHAVELPRLFLEDRKSTRLNSSH